MRLRRVTFVFVAVVASLLFVGGLAQGQTFSAKGASEIDSFLQRAVQQGSLPFDDDTTMNVHQDFEKSIGRNLQR